MDPGEYVIKPRFKDHTFSPARRTITLDKDEYGINFTNTTSRSLSGKVEGGRHTYIGDVTLIVSSENFCIPKIEVSTEPKLSSYLVDLPPQKYFIKPVSVDAQTIPAGILESDLLKFFKLYGTREIDLTEADSLFNIIYRAPLVVKVEGLEDSVGLTYDGKILPDVPVIAQLDSTPITIRIYEKYGDEEANWCPVDTGTITIFDEIMDEESRPQRFEFSNGQLKYMVRGNTPNIFPGRKDDQGIDRSFQKALQIVVNVEGKQPYTHTEWALVTGHKPRAGTFTATTENMPLFILRDPPGDGSHAFIEEGATCTSAISLMTSETLGGGMEIELFAGVNLDKGFIVSTPTEAKVGPGLKFNLEVGHSYHDETKITSTFTQKFSTSNSDLFVGRDGDVYVGAALNWLFAKTDVLKIDGNTIQKSVSVAMQSTGFATTYIFTDSHIRYTLIPQLEELAQLRPDIAEFRNAADNWRKNHLDKNAQLVKDAPLLRNISFSAGANYDYSSKYDTSRAYINEVLFFSNAELSKKIKFEESGSGGEWKFFATFKLNITCAWTNILEKSETHGYTLADDDLGDFFTVDVKNDPEYQTPVFVLKSGTSSCPWEPGPQYLDKFLAGEEPDSISTQPRDGVAISVTPMTSPDNPLIVPADQPAVFTLSLTNESDSEETREYILMSLNASNPGGGVISVNGSRALGTKMPFILAPPPNATQEATLEIRRGPRRYKYERIALLFTPPCEFARWENNAPLLISDTAFVDIQFEAPCSDITLMKPAPGWIYSREDDATQTSLQWLITDYDLEYTDKMTAIVVEAERLGTDLTATGDIVQLYREEIDVENMTPEQRKNFKPEISGEWKISEQTFLSDGRYEIRAKTVCACPGGCFVFSNPAVGTIDRRAPEVFGTPEPADGVLNLGESISITFNEDINCGSIREGKNVKLFLGNDILAAPKQYTTVCDGRTIIFKLLLPDADLEGKILRAEVVGLSDFNNDPSLTSILDLSDNPLQDTKTWTCTVKNDDFSWQSTNITVTLNLNSADNTFQAKLVNGTPSTINYTLQHDTTYANLLTASAIDGTLGAIGSNETQTIEFEIDRTGLNDGDQIVTYVVASGSNLIATLNIMINVALLCDPPNWLAELNPGKYVNSMNIIAELYTDGSTLSVDENDLVAAYVGDQLRGVAPVQETDLGSGQPDLRYLVYLTVYSNVNRGEYVHFKVWDNDPCKLYSGADEMVEFVADSVLGSGAMPFAIHAADNLSNIVTLDIPIYEGWNWFSTNVEPLGNLTNVVLSTINANVGDIIKSQTTFGEYNFVQGVGTWVGTLDTIGNVESYMLKVREPGNLFTQGRPVDLVANPVPIATGWKWISYRHGRDTSYLMPPAQIPACSFPAPGSSEILASAIS